MHVLTALLLLPLLQEPWPGFRGPQGSGHAPGEALPASFDPAGDLLWRLPTPRGFSSPVLAGDLVVITGEDRGRPVVLAVDAAHGRLRWRRWLSAEHVPASKDGRFVPATAATDGRVVVVQLPSLGLVALDLQGEVLWRRELGPRLKPFPLASSPVLADGVLYQLHEHPAGGNLFALDPLTGAEHWHAEWPSGLMAYSTPLVTGDQVVVSGPTRARGLDRATGEQLWSLGGTAWQSRPMPVAAGDLIYIQSAMPAAGLEGIARIDGDWAAAKERWDADGDGQLQPAEFERAQPGVRAALVDADESGSIDGEEWARFASWTRSGNGLWAIPRGARGDAEEQVVWHERRGVPYNTTPLVLDGQLLLYRDGGLVSLRDARTGALGATLRVDELAGEAFASPILVGEEVVLCSVEGQVAVLARGEEGLGVRLTWDLAEPLYATPAVGNGLLVVRTEAALYGYRLDDRPLPPALALVGVGVLAPDGESVLPDRTLIVRGSRISAEGPSDQVTLPADVVRLECAPGQVVVPGLIDLWTEVEDVGELHLHLLAGVTQLRTVDGRPELLRWRSRVRDHSLLGPRWWIGAPTLPADRPKLREEDGSRYYGAGSAAVGAAAAVDRALADGYDFVSAEVGMGREGWLAAAERARALGVPLAGAVPFGLTAAEAEEAGAWTLDRAEVLFGSWEGRTPRPKGPPPRRVARQLARVGLPVTPLLSGFLSAHAALERLYAPPEDPLLRDVSPMGHLLWSRPAHNARRHLFPEHTDRMPPVSRWQQRLVRELADAGAVLLAGSDAMAPDVLPGRGLFDELVQLRACGLSPAAVLRAATAAPAGVLGSDAGVIEVGRPADLVLLAGDPLADLGVLAAPLLTMVGGRPMTRAALEAGMAEARGRYELEASFVDTVATWPVDDPPGLAAYLASEQARGARVERRTVRRLVELFRHPGIRLEGHAAALEAYEASRW